MSKTMVEKPIPDKPVVKPPKPPPVVQRWYLSGEQVVIKEGGYSDKYTIVMFILKDNRNDQEYMVFTNRGFSDTVLQVVPVVKGK